MKCVLHRRSARSCDIVSKWTSKEVTVYPIGKEKKNIIIQPLQRAPCCCSYGAPKLQNLSLVGSQGKPAGRTRPRDVGSCLESPPLVNHFPYSGMAGFITFLSVSQADTISFWRLMTALLVSPVCSLSSTARKTLNKMTEVLGRAWVNQNAQQGSTKHAWLVCYTNILWLSLFSLLTVSFDHMCEVSFQFSSNISSFGNMLLCDS